MTKNDDDVSDDFKSLDDLKYIAKVLKGRKPRISFRPYMEDSSGNMLYREHCKRGCCKSTISISINESDESISKKIKQLLNVPCEFETPLSDIFKEELSTSAKHHKDDPLNNPRLSLKEKLAYIDTIDADEEYKQLLRESVQYE